MPDESPAVRKLCPLGHAVRPFGPGGLDGQKAWTGCPSSECQFCGSFEIDLTYYGGNYAWCKYCYRMSVPITPIACWIALKMVKARGKLTSLSSRTLLLDTAPVGQANEMQALRLTHAEALALRVLERCDHEGGLALAILRTYAAAACVLY